MEYEVSDEIWKQTGTGLKVARLCGLFDSGKFVSAFSQKDRAEHLEIEAAVKAEWESVE